MSYKREKKFKKYQKPNKLMHLDLVKSNLKKKNYQVRKLIWTLLKYQNNLKIKNLSHKLQPVEK